MLATVTYVWCIIIFVVATNVRFEQQTYNVDEYDEIVKPVLILSNPLSNIAIIKVHTTNGSAAGE